MTGNVSSEDIEAMIAARLANLKRLYKVDGRVSRYHKIKELEIIIAKIKELKNARRQEPNYSPLPADAQRGFPSRLGQRQLVAPAGTVHP